MMDAQSLLQFRLKIISEVFNLGSIIDRQVSSASQIARYYRLNRLGYYLLNSRVGFVHMGISRDGTFKPEDFLGQAKIVESYIKKAKAANVLELAAGKAATTIYLAKKHPRVTFTGQDLPHGQLGSNQGLANLVLKKGDYHDLSEFGDSSFEVVYIIEALCHARSKQQVINEVKRVLKPGGYFIVFDGYSSKPLGAMNEQEQLLSRLIYKSMMVDTSKRHYQDFKDAISQAGLQITEEENLSQAIKPSLLRLERQAEKFFKYPRITKVVNHVLPQEVTANAVAAYLMPLTVEAGLHEYWLSVTQKPVLERR